MTGAPEVAAAQGDTELATIAIMTFNRARLLRRAVMSALAQDYPHVEVIISDNGSVDNTATVAQELMSHDARVRYIRHESNIGAVANFNGAAVAAQGKYFMWLADDDWLEPNFLTECIAVYRKSPHVALVGGRGRYITETGSYYERPIRLSQPDRAKRVVEYFRTVNENGIFYGVARTDVLRAHLPMKNVIATDWLLVAGLAFSGPILSVHTTELVRSTSGSSRNVRNLPANFGLSTLSRSFPLAAITLAVGQDLLRSPTFLPLGTVERLRLAMRCSVLVYRRVFRQLYGFSMLQFGSRCLRRCLPMPAFDALRHWYLSRVNTAESVTAK